MNFLYAPPTREIPKIERGALNSKIQKVKSLYQGLGMIQLFLKTQTGKTDTMNCTRRLRLVF